MSEKKNGIGIDTKQLIGRTTWLNADTPRNWKSAFEPELYDQPKGTKFLAKGERALSPVFNRALVALGSYIDAVKLQASLPTFVTQYVELYCNATIGSKTLEWVQIDDGGSVGNPIIEYSDYKGLISIGPAVVGMLESTAPVIKGPILTRSGLSASTLTRHSVTISLTSDYLLREILPGTILKITWAQHFEGWHIVSGVSYDTSMGTLVIHFSLPVTLSLTEDPVDPAISLSAIQEALYNPQVSTLLDVYDETITDSYSIELWPSYFGPFRLLDFSDPNHSIVASTASPALSSETNVACFAELKAATTEKFSSSLPSTLVPLRFGSSIAPTSALWESSSRNAGIVTHTKYVGGLFRAGSPVLEVPKGGTGVIGDTEASDTELISWTATLSSLTEESSSLIEYPAVHRTYTFESSIATTDIDLLQYRVGTPVVITGDDGISMLLRLTHCAKNTNNNLYRITLESYDAVDTSDRLTIGTSYLCSAKDLTMIAAQYMHSKYLGGSFLQVEHGYNKYLEVQDTLTAAQANISSANIANSFQGTSTIGNLTAVKSTVTELTVSKIISPVVIESDKVLRRKLYFCDLGTYGTNRRLVLSAQQLAHLNNISALSVNVGFINNSDFKAFLVPVDTEGNSILDATDTQMIFLYAGYILVFHSHTQLNMIFEIYCDTAGGWGGTAASVYYQTDNPNTRVVDMVNELTDSSPITAEFIGPVPNNTTVSEFFGCTGNNKTFVGYTAPYSFFIIAGSGGTVSHNITDLLSVCLIDTAKAYGFIVEANSDAMIPQETYATVTFGGYIFDPSREAVD
jgi:hypothetical protein